jgi:hypothetical protein
LNRHANVKLAQALSVPRLSRARREPDGDTFFANSIEPEDHQVHGLSLPKQVIHQPVRWSFAFMAPHDETIDFFAWKSRRAVTVA